MVLQKEKEEMLGVRVPTNLLCEYTSNPLGIDVVQPRFFWVCNHSERGQIQSAYQILVGSNWANLDTENGDEWDSGKVVSEESINISYAGNSLESGKTYFWKVRIWDKNGKVSTWSKVATFEMSLLKPDDWKAHWIGLSDKKNEKGPLFRKEFKLDKDIARARVYISGLGYYELRINGKRVGDYVLDPGRTDYSKRVLYVTYDITNFLKKGTNAVGIMLGNGWYNAQGVMGEVSYGLPKLILQINIDFVDNTTTRIISDSTWKIADGPIISNNVYLGESYDARLEKPGWDTPNYNDITWNDAKIVESPGGVMKAQMLQPIKVLRIIKPIKITNPKSGIYIYDMGQNMVGWVKLFVRGIRGTKITLKFAERLYDNGMINPKTAGSEFGITQTETYILKGKDIEVWQPRFTYHGFRYVEVTGFLGKPTLESIKGCVVHSAVEHIGEFTTSSALLNQIQRNILWTQLGNLHSVPTDCPHREKSGWLGDAQVTAEEAIYNFNMSRFYTKWLNDIMGAQDEETGDLPAIVPSKRVKKGGAPPAWGSAYILIPWYLYLYYGDERVLKQHYGGMSRWVDFLSNKAKDYILSYGLGDWCPPGYVSPKNTPVTLTSTGYYYYNVLIISQVAQILGKSDDAIKYSKLANCIKMAFNNKFFNENDNYYATGSQCSNAFPLFLGLVPEDRKMAVLKNLVRDIVEIHKSHLNTGIFGTKYMMEVLTNYGQVSIAYTIATQTTYPSWGYEISKGATTLWEVWDYGATRDGYPDRSRNHPMFGSISSWFYKTLAGINIDPAGPGWWLIIIKPHIVGDLDYVSASIKTIRGMVSSSWTRRDSSLVLNVILPVNSQARVSVPKMGLESVIVKESGRTIWKDGSYVEGVMGIVGGDKGEDYVTFDIGSGSYFFEMSGE